MAIAIDSSTPAPSKLTGVLASPATSNSFSPPANSLILVGFSACSIATEPPPGTNLPTGGGLTYTKLIEKWDGSNDYAGLWWAFATSAPGSMSISITLTNIPQQGGLLQPVVLTGCSSNQSGAGTGFQSATGQTPSVSVTTTASGSQVFGMEANFTSTTSPTVASGQTITINGNSTFFTTSGNGYWMQTLTSPSGAAGTVTLSASAPTGLDITFVAAEILATATAADLSVAEIN